MITYEIAIPLEEIGTTADRIASSGIGIELAATFGPVRHGFPAVRSGNERQC
ncbi:MAG: hypothetical protein V9G11_00705 [Bifidobacterium adolescentis]